MTGIEPEMDSTLDEIGLASVGIPVIVGMINSACSTKKILSPLHQQIWWDARLLETWVSVV
jgi:hypothetical protein